MFRRSVLSQRRDDVPQTEQPPVDVDALLQPVAGGLRLLGPLRAGQVHQVQLGRGRVARALGALLQTDGEYAVTARRAHVHRRSARDAPQTALVGRRRGGGVRGAG